MPQLFIPISVSVAWASTATAIAAVWNAFVIQTALSFAAKKLLGRPRGLRAQPTELTSAWSGTEPGVMVFGQRAVPGREVFKGTSGTNNRYLWIVYELARHQCEDVGTIWLDDNEIASANIDGMTGQVTAGALAVDTYIWKHLGRSDQSVDTNVQAAFTAWNSNHKGVGVTYIVVRYTYNKDRFPSGPPANVRALVKGQRLYDPRKDSTNGGSGSHRYDNPTTWEWSNNPTLCRISYLLGGSVCYDVNSAPFKGLLGYGVAPDQIDWTQAIASANIDDESVSGGSAPPTGAQTRYTCDGVLSTGNQLADNLQLLDTAAAGVTIGSGGYYYVFSGAYDAPTFSIDETNLAGDVQYMPHTPHADRFNSVGGTYFDAALNAQTEFRTRTDSSYVTRDGGRDLPRQIELLLTTDPYRAQRIAEIHLNLGNQQGSLFWQGDISCIPVSLWQTVSVTISEFSLSNAPFRCTGWEWDGVDKVKLELKALSAGAYADPATADYLSATPSTADPPVPDALAPPTNFRASGAPSGIVFQWDLPEPFQTGTVFELYEYTASISFGDATKIATTTSNNYTLPRSDTTQRYYWLIARRSAFVSTNVPSTDGLPAKAASVAAGLSASVSVGTISHVYSGSATATSESTTVTATGGTPGYTYAWTRVSGSTDISADSASAATTTFSVVSMADGATKSAIFRCTVTDSTAATYTIDVSVGFERDDVGDLVVAPSVSQTTVKISPTNSFASFKIGADGKWYKGATSGAAVVQGSWVQPNGNANLYSVRVTRAGGSETVFNSGTAGSWLACTTDQNFNITENTDGVASRNIIFTIELALTADTATILSTSTGNQLTASVDA